MWYGAISTKSVDLASFFLVYKGGNDMPSRAHLSQETWKSINEVVSSPNTLQDSVLTTTCVHAYVYTHVVVVIF